MGDGTVRAMPFRPALPPFGPSLFHVSGKAGCRYRKEELNMVSPEMKSLIDAPLANASKLNLPQGRQSARGRRVARDPVADAEVRARKAAALNAKVSTLLDYYASADTPAERVAEHVGYFRKEQSGVNKRGKAVFINVPDVERAERELAWRREQRAASVDTHPKGGDAQQGSVSDG
jgi:hypothetical protein